MACWNGEQTTVEKTPADHDARGLAAPLLRQRPPRLNQSSRGRDGRGAGDVRLLTVWVAAARALRRGLAADARGLHRARARRGDGPALRRGALLHERARAVDDDRSNPGRAGRSGALGAGPAAAHDERVYLRV